MAEVIFSVFFTEAILVFISFSDDISYGKAVDYRGTFIFYNCKDFRICLARRKRIKYISHVERPHLLEEGHLKIFHLIQIQILKQSSGAAIQKGNLLSYRKRLILSALQQLSRLLQLCGSLRGS